MSADPIEAIRTALLTMPTVVDDEVGISIGLQGPDPQVRISSTGGPPGMYPGHFEVEVLLDVFGRGGAENAPVPVDDGTAARLAFGLYRDVEAITGKIPTAYGEVASLGADRGPSESDDPLTDRPQWTLPLRAHVFEN